MDPGIALQVTVAGVTVSKTAFLQVDRMNKEALTTNFDGILGMGFSESTVSGTMSWFERAFKRNRLLENKFAVWLSRGTDLEKNFVGEISLGFALRKYMNGKLSSQKLNRK